MANGDLMLSIESTVTKPATDDAMDLGSSALQFKDLYIDGSAYIDGLGENILVATDKQIQFRDTAIYIASNDDGHLDLMADISIDLNTLADTDLVLNFFGTTNSGVLTWMEDEDQFKFTDRIQTDGGIIGKITTVTNTYQILVTDETIVCNKTTAFVVTMPTAVVGQVFEISNINIGSVTVTGSGTDTIDGQTTQVLGQWDTMKVRCYVANKWSII
jgi:hypothetical protein